MREIIFGLIGLGTMGRNLALNACDHGRGVIGFDSNPMTRQLFHNAQAGRVVSSLAELVASLQAPRFILLLLPAGAAVDDVIARLKLLLAPGDMIVDAGNSYFRDSERRSSELHQAGIEFVGLGVSGGEAGARCGAALMAGGAVDVVERLWQVIGPMAASAEGRPCRDRFGNGGAGHFVKMVHNGIEYADMQMIAEIVHFLRRGYGLHPAKIGETFACWNDGPIGSYLCEITADIMCTVDAQTYEPFIDCIVDVAGKNGTGYWTVITAMELDVAIPTISAAVDARNLTSGGRRSEILSACLSPKVEEITPQGFDDAHDALWASRLCALAQGFALMARGRQHFAWDMSLADVAANWRAGCIVRSHLLSDVLDAFHVAPDLENLLWADAVAAQMPRLVRALRRVVGTAMMAGISVPGLASALAYLQAHGSVRLWADVIQAQRDFFGAHGIRLIGKDGLFHGPWQGEQ